jgi:hypothetical protein
MKTMTDYQLDTLRARFASRGYEPLNRSRSHHVIFWVVLGINCILAAILFSDQTNNNNTDNNNETERKEKQQLYSTPGDRQPDQSRDCGHH